MAGCNYVYDNNGPIVSDRSGLAALTAGCSIMRCCLSAQLERNTDMMTHNWSFKALVYTSDSYWSRREPGEGENMRGRAMTCPERTTHTHTHTGFESEGGIFQ